MENKYLEIIKYNDLLEEMNLDYNKGIELEMKNMNDSWVTDKFLYRCNCEICF